jgi:very-short-patch-repair endonuclease
MWGLIEEPAAEVVVTCVAHFGHAKPGLRVHRVPTLDRDDLARRQRLPVTSVARTIVDLGGVLDPIELESAIATARRRRLVSDDEILAAVGRAPRRRGAGLIRTLLAGNGELARTRSKYERKLLRLVREAGLPRPSVNARIGGFEVDFLWPVQRLVVEFDGFGFHGDRRAFERDRERDRRLALLGYQVIRVTALQLDSKPFAVVASIAGVLGRRGGLAA